MFEHTRKGIFLVLLFSKFNFRIIGNEIESKRSNVFRDIMTGTQSTLSPEWSSGGPPEVLFVGVSSTF